MLYFNPLRNTDNLLVVDLTTNQVIDIIDLYPEAEHPLGPAPQRVALTTDGTRLLIINSNDESITLFDTTTLTPIKTFRLNHWLGGVAVAPDGSVAYVSVNADDELIWVIDIAAPGNGDGVAYGVSGGGRYAGQRAGH
jgi:DNA-binding beta-propeller fold protein YncE